MSKHFLDVNMRSLQMQPFSTAFENDLSLSDNLEENTRQYIPQSLPENRLAPLRYTTTFIAMLCLEGEIRTQINQMQYTLQPNDLLLITHNQTGILLGSLPGTRFISLAIGETFYDPRINSDKVAIQQKLFSNHPSSHLTSIEAKELLDIYQATKSKIKQENIVFKREIVFGYVHAFFFNILSLLALREEHGINIQQETSKQEDLFKNFMDLVQEYYVRERSVKFYAQRLNITPKYLSQIIYKVSGRFAGEYIEEFVIVEAKSLLTSHRYSIQEVSDMLHFSSQSLFCRFFKKATGSTPMQFKK